MTPTGLDGVVLAGGASRRMGRDKARLLVGGQRLVDRAVAALETVCDVVVVASGDGRRLPSLRVPQVSDTRPGAGPLAAILAGIEATTAELVAVLAVDIPEPSPAVLRLLARVHDGSSVAVVPTVDGNLQPLHAVYGRGRAGELRALFDGGERSPRRACAALGAQVVGPEVWGRVEASAAFGVDLDVPADLERWTAGREGA